MEEGTAASAYRQGREQRTNGSSVAGGTDYIFQPSPPISSARRHVFHSNDRAPWITSGVGCTPIGALHSDNDNVTVPEGQWRWCSVLTANREGGAHLQWAMTTLKSAASEAEKHGLIHIPALRWETPRSWNSSQPDPPTPPPPRLNFAAALAHALVAMSQPGILIRVLFSTRSEPRPPESNLIKGFFSVPHSSHSWVHAAQGPTNRPLWMDCMAASHPDFIKQVHNHITPSPQSSFLFFVVLLTRASPKNSKIRAAVCQKEN